MDRILIRGGTPLTGTIPIGGAKNAALPLMAASLLTAEPLVLANLPDLADIRTMASLLVQHGVAIALAAPVDAPNASRQILELNAKHITSTTAPYDLVRKMRASVLVLGPLVARFGRCRVSLPGGCAIGTRPVDLHLKGLQRLGAEVELSEGYSEACLLGPRVDHVEAVVRALETAEVCVTESAEGIAVRRRNGRLTGTDVMTEPYPGFPTDLQAQIMTLMATAEGASMITETIFENRFMHVPELVRMGANINVHGASALVRGVPRLTGAPVMATDLRASVSLVIAGLVAGGET